MGFFFKVDCVRKEVMLGRDLKFMEVSWLVCWVKDGRI